MADRVYTLVSYRSDGADYCRGCLMASSSSDFKLEVFTTADEAAALWAKKMKLDRDRERHYADWDVTLLIDGRRQNDWADDQDDDDPQFEQIETLAKAYLQKLCDDEAEVKRKAAEAAAVAAAEKQRLAAIAKEDSERKRLVELLDKYGNPE